MLKDKKEAGKDEEGVDSRGTFLRSKSMDLVYSVSLR